MGPACWRRLLYRLSQLNHFPIGLPYVRRRRLYFFVLVQFTFLEIFALDRFFSILERELNVSSAKQIMYKVWLESIGRTSRLVSVASLSR